MDKAAFHINLKRNLSWSKEGSRTVVKVPRTRTKTTIILGTISPFGVVNISVRRPLALAPSKKRKVNGGTKAKESNNGDNSSIHTHEDIQKHIEIHGYGCVYLPPYSPELNSIGRFWSVCKSKLKREQPLDEETPTTRIADACNRVLYSDLQGFCRYSASKFDDRLNLYTNVMRILKSKGQKSDYERQPDHEALIYLSEKRLEYRKKRLDCEELQIIEILETVIQNIIFSLNGDESELECMEGCCSILKTVFRGSKYKFKLGEQACIESKNVREENEKAFGNNQTLDSTRNIMGRRIDLLLSSFETNISSCEWKAENVSPSIARSQESKNIRVNASILEALLRLPHEKNDDDRSPFVLMYSDWIGRDGCINAIVKEDDAFIVKKLGDVFIPTSLHEIDEHFKLTIKRLYT
ncbi:hypothetical protein G6F61_010362 [Rhizopus arrhizus]|nr:hypothetical protein G6F24_011873 [Rhizopus arrhizus]KAG1373221.1 hypothetical protein G6F61_010362 [Rhizopus arrhizus]